MKEADEVTQKAHIIGLDATIVDTPLPPIDTNVTEILPAVRSPWLPNSRSRSSSKRLESIANVQIIQERCRQICLSSFFRRDTPIRSLGFTSAIAGEGKSFLTMVMANVLAND